MQFQKLKTIHVFEHETWIQKTHVEERDVLAVARARWSSFEIC
jgi:hypothetical protein